MSLGLNAGPLSKGRVIWEAWRASIGPTTTAPLRAWATRAGPWQANSNRQSQRSNISSACIGNDRLSGHFFRGRSWRRVRLPGL